MSWEFSSGSLTGKRALVTALPSAPRDGDECVLADSLTAPTWSWLLRYVAAKASNKWAFIGGLPFREAVSGTSTATGNGTALGTGLVLPAAGNYDVHFGGLLTRATPTEWLYVYLKAGNGTLFTTIIAWLRTTTDTDSHLTLSSASPLNGMAAGATVKLYLANSNGTSQVGVTEGFLRITPAAIGG